jgi:large subunit ribosomal protein L33
MAKGPKNEYVWLECTECSDRNYRTTFSAKSQGQPTKLELNKYCPRERKHTLHKMRKK